MKAAAVGALVLLEALVADGRAGDVACPGIGVEENDAHLRTFSGPRAFERGAWAAANTWLKPGAATRTMRSLGSFSMTVNWSGLKWNSFLPHLP
eukprot:6370533-Pyramimonas_sp.AAC.1